MSSHEDWLRRSLLNVKRARALDEPILRFRREPLVARNPIGVATQRVRLRHAIQKLQFATARQTTKRAVSDFITLLVKLSRLQMVADKRNDLRANVVTVERVYVQP